MDRITYIYALLDPRNSEVRYIGKTVDIKMRIYRHCTSKKKTKSASWIKSIYPLMPEIVVIESVLDDWQEAEQFWISYFRFCGANLTNLTYGGEGSHGYSPPAASRLKMSQAAKGRTRSAEHQEKLAASRRGRKMSEEQRQKLSLAHIGKKPTTDARARQSEAQVGRRLSEETKIKISNSNKGKKLSADQLQRMIAGCKNRKPSAESNEKRRQKLVGRVFSEESIQKMRAAAACREQKKRDTMQPSLF